MYWNHRVMRRTEGGTKHLYIVEVYYEDFRDEGPPSILGWTEKEEVWGDEEYDGIEGLRKTLTWMLECLDKPILDEAELLAMAEEREPLTEEDYETYTLDEVLDSLGLDREEINSWEDDGGNGSMKGY